MIRLVGVAVGMVGCFLIYYLLLDAPLWAAVLGTDLVARLYFLKEAVS